MVSCDQPLSKTKDNPFYHYAGAWLICVCNNQLLRHHSGCRYRDVIMSAMASQINGVTQPFVQAQIKWNIQAPRHWLLWGEFTGDRRIPHTKGQWRRKCFHLMSHDIGRSATRWFPMYWQVCLSLFWRIRTPQEGQWFVSFTHRQSFKTILCLPSRTCLSWNTNTLFCLHILCCA